MYNPISEHRWVVATRSQPDQAKQSELLDGAVLALLLFVILISRSVCRVFVSRPFQNCHAPSRVTTSAFDLNCRSFLKMWWTLLLQCEPWMPLTINWVSNHLSFFRFLLSPDMYLNKLGPAKCRSTSRRDRKFCQPAETGKNCWHSPPLSLIVCEIWVNASVEWF